MILIEHLSGVRATFFEDIGLVINASCLLENYIKQVKFPNLISNNCCS